MGNSIKISIHLDYENTGQPPSDGTVRAVQAGEPLAGTVIIHIKKRVQGGELKLFASGQEKVYSKQKEKRITNERNLLQVVWNLADMRDQWVERGNYSFEFRIDMPESLPSSMSWGDDRHGCHVRYKISAGMGRHTTEKFFCVASAPLPDVKVPCFIEPKTETIKSMGFLNTGSVTFGASVDDTQAGRGQQIDVALACVNNTTIDIRSVEIKLVELITYSSHGQSYVRKLPLLMMKHVEMPGLDIEKTSREMVLLNRGLPNVAHITSCDQIYQALYSGDNAVRITIPKTARDTYAGGIVKVQHYIKIKIMTGAFADNLATKIPIHIGNIIRMHDQRPEQPLPAAPATVIEQPLPSAPSDEIQMVQAIPIPTAPARVSTESTVVHAHAVILGGTAVQYEHDEPDVFYDPSDERVDFDTLMPLAPPPPQSVPSLDRLLQDMTASVNDYNLISQRIEEWKHVFENLQPGDFGNIITHVNNDFDQPRVAVMVAGCIKRFTCAHCVAALRNTTNWNRIAMVVQLVPLCTDLESQRGLILAELSQWEQTVTASDFEHAVANMIAS